MLYYNDEPNILALKNKDIAVIIPVNCKGVMGAGLAKQFADKYPNLVNAYKESCNDGSISIGHCVLQESEYGNFIFFPTKDDWRNPSTFEYIEAGLDSLVRCLDAFPSMAVAIPPLGCGLGGLSYTDILPIIYEKTKECSNDLFLVGF